MAAPGVKNMGMGLLWAVGGFAVTGLLSGSGVVAIGALGIGLLQFLWGLGQFLFRTRSALDRILRGASDETKALVRTVIHAAESEGPLDEGKIARIRTVLRGIDFDGDANQLSDVSPEMRAAILSRTENAEYPADRLRELSAAMHADKRSTLAYLQSVRLNFTAPVKQTIVRACAIVLAGDGRLTESRRKVMAEIGQALDISQEDFGAATARL
jgi:hypothetical protein